MRMMSIYREHKSFTPAVPRHIVLCAMQHTHTCTLISRTYIHTHVHTHTRIHTHADPYTHEHTHTHTCTEESACTLQSLGLRIDRNRAIASDPLQVALEVHLGLPFLLLEIILPVVNSSSAVDSKRGYVGIAWLILI